MRPRAVRSLRGTIPHSPDRRRPTAVAEERSGVTTGRRWLRRAAAIAAGVAAALPILVYLGVSYSIASGLTTGEREPLEDHPSAYGLEFEDVSFPSRRGDVVLKGWHMRGRGDRPSVIFVHGITANRASNEMLGPRGAACGTRLQRADVRPAGPWRVGRRPDDLWSQRAAGCPGRLRFSGPARRAARERGPLRDVYGRWYRQ